MPAIFLHTRSLREYEPVPVADTFRILPTYISFCAQQTKVIESKGEVY